MKRTSSNSPRSAWWTWHISAPMLCMASLSLSSQFHIRLALSRSLLQYLSPSWLVPQNPHQPYQTPSLSPCRANVIMPQTQVCQGRVVLQTLCQCLTGEKYLQSMWWNHLKSFEIHKKEISTPSTALFSYFRSYSHIMWSPMKWKEQAQVHSDLNNGFGTSQHQCSVWPPFHSVRNFTFDWLCLDPYCSTSPPHDRFLSILTKHQAWAPVSPMLLWYKARFVRVELCFRPSANASQETKICKIRGEIIQNSLKFTYKKSQRLLPSLLILPLILTHHPVSNEMKRPRSNSLRSAWWAWHILAPILCVVFLSQVSPISPSTSSVWIHIVLPPLMTDFSGSWPSSPNTKPEPLQGQCCCPATTGMSGSSCASFLLPMPDSRSRCAKYAVKSSNLRNSHKDISMPSTVNFLILALILTYYVVSSEMKRTSSNSLSAWWTWHISAPILCSLPFTHFTISPSALSGSILPYLPPSWPIPQHPHQTPSLSPRITNLLVMQSQVCQGRVVLQSFCQCLTANKDVQNTWWNHLKLYWNSHARNLNAFSRILLILPLICTYHVVCNEMKRTNSNSLRSRW